jgi:hypothetical protein
VADVIYNLGVKGVEQGEGLFETKVAFGGEQALRESECRCEEYTVAALDEFVANCAYEVGLSSARQS